MDEVLINKAKNRSEILEPITIDLLNSNRHILIVDDEPYNIMGIKVILLQSGYQGIVNIIDEAFNGQEAFNKVKEAFTKGYSYGLILMDCSMPIVDGYDACDMIRGLYRK